MYIPSRVSFTFIVERRFTLIIRRLARFFRKTPPVQKHYFFKTLTAKHSAVQLDTTRTPFFTRANKGLKTFGKRHGLLLVLSLFVLAFHSQTSFGLFSHEKFSHCTFADTQGRAYGRTRRAGEFKFEFPPSPLKHCRYAT